jgi:hypothetical protein
MPRARTSSPYGFLRYDVTKNAAKHNNGTATDIDPVECDEDDRSDLERKMPRVAPTVAAFNLRYIARDGRDMYRVTTSRRADAVSASILPPSPAPAALLRRTLSLSSSATRALNS